MKDHPDFDELINSYRNIDFSAESQNKENIHRKLLAQMENQGRMQMKRKKRTSILVYVAAVSIVFTFTMSAYGQEIIHTIKEFSLGQYAHYYSQDQPLAAEPLPQELAGKLFDRKGNVITQPPKDGIFYNQNGERVVIEREDSGAEYLIITKAEADRRAKENVTAFYRLEEAKPHFAEAFLMPAYLPEGYAFDRAEFYNGDDGKPEKGSDYMSLYFGNGEGKAEITIMLRVLNEETGITSGGNDVEEITVGDHKAILFGKGLDIEIDGILYSLYANEDVSREETIRMAESLN